MVLLWPDADQRNGEEGGRQVPEQVAAAVWALVDLSHVDSDRSGGRRPQRG